MNSKTATADLPGHSRLSNVVTLTLYALGISAGAFVGLMGLLLAA